MSSLHTKKLSRLFILVKRCPWFFHIEKAKLLRQTCLWIMAMGFSKHQRQPQRAKCSREFRKMLFWKEKWPKWIHPMWSISFECILCVCVCETWSTYRGFSWREGTEMYKVRLAQRQLKPGYSLDYNHSICCTLYSFPLLLCCRTFCVSNCDLLSATQPYWYTIDYYRSKWKYVQKMSTYIDDPTWAHAHTRTHSGLFELTQYTRIVWNLKIWAWEKPAKTVCTINKHYSVSPRAISWIPRLVQLNVHNLWTEFSLCNRRKKKAREYVHWIYFIHKTTALHCRLIAKCETIPPMGWLFLPSTLFVIDYDDDAIIIISV